jgi:hypothetical protein
MKKLSEYKWRPINHFFTGSMFYSVGGFTHINDKSAVVINVSNSFPLDNIDNWRCMQLQICNHIRIWTYEEYYDMELWVYKNHYINNFSLGGQSGPSGLFVGVGDVYGAKAVLDYVEHIYSAIPTTVPTIIPVQNTIQQSSCNQCSGKGIIDTGFYTRYCDCSIGKAMLDK